MSEATGSELILLCLVLVVEEADLQDSLSVMSFLIQGTTYSTRQIVLFLLTVPLEFVLQFESIIRVSLLSF